MFDFSNLCRICLSEKRDDFECLTEQGEADDGLSEIGRLYVELFQLPISKDETSPKFICKYCLLQIKLFSEFRAKAVKSYKSFQKIYSEDKTDESLTQCNENSSDNVVIVKAEDSLETFDEDCYADAYSDVQYLEDDADLVLEYCESGADLEDVIPSYQTERQAEDVEMMRVVRNSHESSGEVECKSCNKIFRGRTALYNHRRKDHKRQKLFCTACDKTFLSEETLNVHMKLHKGLPAYNCEECGKTFKQKAHFQYHQLGHRNERNVQCHLCGKAFLSKSDLRIHLRVHNDERRYECDICKKRFRAHTHMTNHRYQHFDEKLECDICFQKYSSPNTLRTHKKSIHSNVFPYVCDACPKKFKRKHHLTNHQKVHFKTGDTSVVPECVLDVGT